MELLVWLAIINLSMTAVAVLLFNLLMAAELTEWWWLRRPWH